jgi:hypothetical protein
MTAIVRQAEVLVRRAEAGFWRAAAAVTGFAVHHPRIMRALPIAAIAAAAYFVGREAGQILAGAF